MRDKAVALLIAIFVLGEVKDLSAVSQTPTLRGGQAVTNSSRSMILQKLQLVQMMLEASPAMKRAAEGTDDAIKQKVVAANERFVGATDALNQNNLAGAEELADEALRLIEEISQLNPDLQQIRAEQIKRYDESVRSLDNAEATYRDLSSRLKSSEAKDMGKSISRLRKKAQILAMDGQYSEASELIKEAHEEVISALNKLLGSTALLYDLKFNSVAEEYDYELARYHSFEELAPIAYAELKPDKDTIMLSERYVQESRAMRDIAKQQAARGDHRAAINTLLGAIKQMQTALRVVGLVLQE